MHLAIRHISKLSDTVGRIMMPIPKSSKKRFLRLVSAHTDMAYASEAFRLFQAASGPPADYHLFLSMVLCYCRPFTQSRGIGSILCEYPDYPDYAVCRKIVH